jgi:hypothetical protein
MDIKKRTTAGKGLAMGIVVAAAIVILVYLIYKVVMSALPVSSQSPGKFNSLVKNSFASVQFSPQQKDSIRPLLAGFWEYVHDTTMGSTAVKRLDRLEIKPNGYIWEVDQYQCTPSSGAPFLIVSIANYFTSPFGKVDNKTSDLLCELVILRHVYIFGNDSCYATGVQESTWVMQRNAAGLSVQGHQYQPFDTAGRLHQFFPAGAIKLADKVDLKQCPPSANVLARIEAGSAARQ